MFLNEDRELISIYNKLILSESKYKPYDWNNFNYNKISIDNIPSQWVDSELADEQVKFLFDVSYKSQKSYIDSKIQSHIDEGSGSSFRINQNTTIQDVLSTIFDGQNWKKYNNVGGDSIGYYKELTEPCGILGTIPMNYIDNGNSIILSEKSRGNNNCYPIEATVRVNEKNLVDTNIVSMIFFQDGILQSIYPGPQSSNIQVDQSAVNKYGNVRLGPNCLTKNLKAKDVKSIIPFFRINQ